MCEKRDKRKEKEAVNEGGTETDNWEHGEHITLNVPRIHNWYSVFFQYGGSGRETSANCSVMA